MTQKIETQKRDGTLTIIVRGGFNAELVIRFREVLEKIETSDKQIVIDLAGAEYVDSAALGLMIHMKRKFKGSRLENIKISNCNSRIRKTFDTMRFQDMFEIDMMDD